MPWTRLCGDRPRGRTGHHTRRGGRLTITVTQAVAESRNAGQNSAVRIGPEPSRLIFVEEDACLLQTGQSARHCRSRDA